MREVEGGYYTDLSNETLVKELAERMNGQGWSNFLPTLNEQLGGYWTLERAKRYPDWDYDNIPILNQ